MRAAQVAVVLAAAATALATPVAVGAAAPRAHQMVVFRSGAARLSRSSLAPATVTVRRRRCAVAGGTPLAALVHSGVGPLALRDFGSCSRRAADGGGLFVSGIGADRNRGSDGWVYKVGNVLGTAGAADPAGPFGRGRLRAGVWITWFWCHVTSRSGGCQRTLVLRLLPAPRGLVVARITSFDDHGRGHVAAGATLHGGGRGAVADRRGVARLRLRPGRHSVWAGERGHVRSFPAAAVIR